MEKPTIQNKIADIENDVIFNVMAYRKLTRQEVIGTVASFKAKSMKVVLASRGKIIVIPSQLGLAD